MGETVHRESPMARVTLGRRGAAPRPEAGVVARERAFLGHLNLRGDPADARFVAAVNTVLGGGLPLQANTARDAGNASLFWLGPDEWLIVTAAERRTAIETGLRQALVGVRAAVTDISGGQTVLALRGPAVRDVLSKGCPLDLHPRTFDTGQCAQSHLARAPLLLRLVDNAPTFELIVRRSFIDHVWAWLEVAAAEVGLELEP